MKSSKTLINLMTGFVHILQEWDLIDGQTIAIDSFKIRAQNNLKNNFNLKMYYNDIVHHVGVQKLKEK